MLPPPQLPEKFGVAALSLPGLGLAARVVERMVSQNIYDDISQGEEHMIGLGRGYGVKPRTRQMRRKIAFLFSMASTSYTFFFYNPIFNLHLICCLYCVLLSDALCGTRN